MSHPGSAPGSAPRHLSFEIVHLIIIDLIKRQCIAIIKRCRQDKPSVRHDTELVCDLTPAPRRSLCVSRSLHIDSVAAVSKRKKAHVIHEEARPDACDATIRSAIRSATAAIVKLGFAPTGPGNTDPSAT